MDLLNRDKTLVTLGSPLGLFLAPPVSSSRKRCLHDTKLSATMPTLSTEFR